MWLLARLCEQMLRMPQVLVIYCSPTQLPMWVTVTKQGDWDTHLNHVLV